MTQNTKIEWAHHTFNPWWGCARVSPGCEHCYAESFAKRTGHKVWGAASERRFFGDAHWREPIKWNRDAIAAGERHRVFCASMADVFEDRRDLDQWRERLWFLIALTPQLDWMLLTKRPENAAQLVPSTWSKGWPANVWAGTTAEDQRRHDERVPHLLKLPARIRFLSCEPLLGPIDMLYTLSAQAASARAFYDAEAWHSQINLVIVGGESGAGARTCRLEWIRSLIAQCRDERTACFVKQLGKWIEGPADDFIVSRWKLQHGSTFIPPILRHWRERPVNAIAFGLFDQKGGELVEWPDDLRVRELPEPQRAS